jgi:mono/diheme cytochrome c family protein
MFLKNKFAVRSSQFAASRFIAVGFVVVALSFWLVSEIGFAGLMQEPKRNAEAQKLKNPEPANDESVEAGKKLYQRHCASCHGPLGKGDGSLALAGGTPSDLTDETWDFGSTDGEIFVAIRDGVSTDMLAYKDKMTDKQIWQTVHYLRSIGPKPKTERSPKQD